MAVVQLGFNDVDFASEHFSLQRKLASMFPAAEVRRSYQEGAFETRPYLLAALVRPSVPKHSSFAAFALLDCTVTYYATDHLDAERALEKLLELGWKDRRIQLWDYSNPAAPVEMTGYFLRVQDISGQLVPDLNDDTLYNASATLTIEGKRSVDKYSGTVIDQIPMSYQNP